MDITHLQRLGFTVCAGQIDREHVNYGFLSADGPVLTPEGLSEVSRLEVAMAEKVAANLEQDAPARRARRPGLAAPQ